MVLLAAALVLQAATVAAFLMAGNARDQRQQQIVADLCQRIQAPDVAVAQHVTNSHEAPQGLPYVPVDDDDALIADLKEQIDGA
jgi:hypothetical protein